MALLESDYIDESFLEEIQCGDCGNSFPLFLFPDHEEACTGYNPELLGFASNVITVEDSDDEDSDDEDSDEEEKDEKPNTSTEKQDIITEAKKEKVDRLIDDNLIELNTLEKIPLPKTETNWSAELEKIVLPKTETPSKGPEKENKGLDNFFVSDFKVTSEDILQENELLSFSSCTNENKQAEEEAEKISFKAVTGSFFKNSDSKPRIQNELTESDNEDGETLEDFWRRGDVALKQHKRRISEMKVGRNAY